MTATRPSTALPAGGGAGVRDRRADALFEEARQLRRLRWRRRITLLLILVLAAALASAIAASLADLAGHRTARPGAGRPLPTGSMPSLIVAWTGSSAIEVLSARTGRVLRTLATGVALNRGLTTVAVSAYSVVYFDQASGRRQWVMSVPLGGGQVRRVAAGWDPAVSPDGRSLVYVTNTDLAGRPEAIVVQDLATGARRRWAFGSAGSDVDSLAWSPTGALLSFTATTAARPFGPASAYMLDVRSGGSLDSARPIPLRRGLEWAAFATAATGYAVMAVPGRAGHGGGQYLVEVAIASGRVLRRLTAVPSRRLFTSNAFAGTEGSVVADTSGRYLLIAGVGPHGSGEIFRWPAGMRRPVLVAGGVVRAAWAP